MRAVTAAARVFEACVRQGLDEEAGGPELWVMTRSAALCRALGRRGLAMIERRLTQARSRDEHNRLARLFVDAWGSPVVTAGLLAVFGYDPAYSYDDLFRCQLKLEDSGLSVNINVFQRLHPADGATWSGENCVLHRHPKWFASRMVVGSVTHTVCRPVCLGEAEPVPAFAELDARLEDADENGTLVDVVGSRYRLSEESGIVCETTEVVRIRAGESYVFSPAWLHRTIPNTAGATHVGVSLQVAANEDIDFGRRNGGCGGEGAPPPFRPSGAPVVLEHGVGVAGVTELRLCWARWELAAALLSSDLDESRGLPVQPCTVRPRSFRGGTETAHSTTDSATGSADRLFLMSPAEERAVTRAPSTPQRRPACR